jgi:hypothetical protein
MLLYIDGIIMIFSFPLSLYIVSIVLIITNTLSPIPFYTFPLFIIRVDIIC